ncbi:hypothetical protein HY992_05290 [Candidatus Micrarchaeota archaeon]|nr:hypothetical protein [Candidatus Micrarchaeota archaeon]
MFRGRFGGKGASASNSGSAPVVVRIFPPSSLARAVEVDWQEFRRSVFKALASSYFISRDLNRRVDALVEVVQNSGLNASAGTVLEGLRDERGSIPLSAKAVEAVRLLVESALKQHLKILEERRREEEDLSKPFAFEVEVRKGFFGKVVTRYTLEGGGRASLEGLLLSAIERELGRLLDVEARVQALEEARAGENLSVRVQGLEARFEGLVEAREGENLVERVRELEARVGVLCSGVEEAKLVERVQALEAGLKSLQVVREDEKLAGRVQNLEVGLKLLARRLGFAFKLILGRLRAVEGSSGSEHSGDCE